MESPLPAVFHDYAKRTQQGDLLVSYWLGYTMIRHGSNKKIKLKFWNTLQTKIAADDLKTIRH